MKRYLFAAVAASLLLACAPKGSAIQTSKPGDQNPVPPSNVTVAAPAPIAPEVEALKTLGFSVFPEPQSLPPIQVATLGGTNRSMADYIGKYVLLNFWATWCPPCKAEMPSMEKMYQQLKGKNFDIFAISVGEQPTTVKNFIDQNKYTFPVALDPKGNYGAIFASRGIPTTYIIDPQGRAIAGVIGGREWNDPHTLSVLRALIEKK